MKKHSLSVGDRVAVYLGGVSSIAVKRRLGLVRHVMPDGTVDVEFQPGEAWFCHPKQCRRLKKRERRRWTLEHDSGTGHWHVIGAEIPRALNRYEVVEVVEVKK